MKDINDDINAVRHVIRRAKGIGYSARWGGLHSLWKEAEEALEALGRIEDDIAERDKPRQADFLSKC